MYLPPWRGRRGGRTAARGGGGGLSGSWGPRRRRRSCPPFARDCHRQFHAIQLASPTELPATIPCRDSALPLTSLRRADSRHSRQASLLAVIRMRDSLEGLEPNTHGPWPAKNHRVLLPSHEPTAPVQGSCSTSGLVRNLIH